MPPSQRCSLQHNRVMARAGSIEFDVLYDDFLRLEFAHGAAEAAQSTWVVLGLSGPRISKRCHANPLRNIDFFVVWEGHPGGTYEPASLVAESATNEQHATIKRCLVFNIFLVGFAF